jgi:predicted N-acetyltransferase YhbS
VIAGCGGWSRRRSLFGGDAGRTAGEGDVLNPAHDAARIRAFFVHPDWARRGIGRQIMHACESAIGQAGFRSIELVATLGGEPLYAAFAYRSVDRYAIPLAGGLGLPAVRMVKDLQGR